MLKAKHVILAIGLSLSAAIAAQAQDFTTISFKNGFANALTGGQEYTGNDTTFLDSHPSNQDRAYGGSIIFKANQERFVGLIQFDLSAFTEPVGAVENAILRLGIRGIPTREGQTGTISIHQMNAANAGWLGGTTNNAEAAPGESSWAFKNAGAAGEPNILWASGSTFSAADYSSAPIATYTYTYGDKTASEADYIDILIPGEIIMGWINSPSSNAGLVFNWDQAWDASVFASNRRNGTQPELTFSYAAVPEPSTYALLLLSAVGGFVCVMRVRKRKV